ncbi:MAG: UDP-N-acetylglucosamine 2-epimerase [Saprospiraceae bacterium]|nr:UDP-N-acetylglucosamine 2-epimerase [Saprospiraceae bacterium]
MELKKEKKILFIVGTRPEAIKICPLVREASTFFDTFVLGTGQHYESVLEVFSLFGISINKIFPAKKFKTTGLQLAYYQQIISQSIESYNPELIVVHGDTTSCFAGALSAYLYKKMWFTLKQVCVHKIYIVLILKKCIENGLTLLQSIVMLLQL